MTSNREFPVKEFDYSGFINDLKPLIEQARAFNGQMRHHDDATFRAWRHRVVDLTTRISRTYMDSDTLVELRQFRVLSYGTVSNRDQQNAFDRDLTDTLLELDLIVENYSKYGEPKLRPGTRKLEALGVPTAVHPVPADQGKPIQAEWPQKERLTLYWLFKHMPVSAWLWLVVLVGGAFTVGVTVGNWPSVQKLMDPASNVTASPGAVNAK